MTKKGLLYFPPATYIHKRPASRQGACTDYGSTWPHSCAVLLLGYGKGIEFLPIGGNLPNGKGFAVDIGHG